MKYLKHLRAFAALTIAGLVMVGCKSNIDLDNIDPHAQVQLGVAVPVASASVTMGDFFGDGKLVEQIQVGTGTDKSLGENGVDKGVLFFQFTKTNDKNYHPIDLRNYLQNVTEEFKISDHFSGSVIPAGTTTVITFPLVMKLKGINRSETLSDERLDRMTISSANFKSKISLKNLTMNKEDIQKVEIVLHGSKRNEGKAPSAITQGFFEVDANPVKENDYAFEVAGFRSQGFGQEIPIEIDNFDIYLMKEVKQSFSNRGEANNNAVDELAFDFKFYIKPNSDIAINSNSAFSYQFIIEFLKYTALYGYFEPSNLMIDKETDTIATLWPGWESLKHMQLALAKPRIDLAVTCAIAAPLMINVNSIYVSNDLGEKREASFDEYGTQKTLLWPFPNDLSISSPLDATVTNVRYLNEQPTDGNLDYLFGMRPDYVHWDYYLTVRNEAGKVQHRLTNNTEIHTDITTTLPFQFMEGMLVDYTDTTDIDWAGMSLDSLTASTGIIDSLGASNVKMRLKIDNTIPLDIRFKFAFLDDSDNPIDLSGLEITEDGKTASDSVYIKAAENVETGGNVSVVNGKQVPTTTTIWMNLSAEQFNKITKATHLVYTATLNTSGKSFKENKWVNVRNISGLKIQLGVAASVEAFLNFDNQNNEND